MSYTPVELRHVRVSRSLLGYNRAMVEQMIEEVAESFETTWRERGELADRVEALEKQITELRSREELLTNTLVAAEQAASEVRDQARRAAETTISEAQQEARAIIRAAQGQRERLLVETRRIEAMLRAALVMVEEDVPSGLDVTRQPAAPVAPAPAADRPARAAGSGWRSSTAPLFVPTEPRPPGPPASERGSPFPGQGSTAPGGTERTVPRAVGPAAPASGPHPGTDRQEGAGGGQDDSGEFKPVALPPPTEPAEPEERLEATSLVQRLGRGGSRDLDWGD
jgi:cell division initiation protein